LGRNFTWDGTRKVQSLQRGQRYSAPDFYPLNTNWRRGVSAYHSWDIINACRYAELKDIDRRFSFNPLLPNDDQNPYYAHYRYDKDNGIERNPDHLFSPWVSAGWSPLEFINMRPAQWLGLLKAMSASGAEYFNVGFFESTHDCFKSLRGFDDPNNYYYNDYYAIVREEVYNDYNNRDIRKDAYHTSRMIWHAAMPSYAQATMTRAQMAFINNNGLPNPDATLLTGDVGNLHITNNPPPFNYDLDAQIVSPANPDATPLAVTRHWITKNATGTTIANNYLITATLQPTNGADNYRYSATKQDPFFNPSIPPNFTADVEIPLPKRPLAQPVPTIITHARTQGSTYIYTERRNGTNIFYQLDGWHQWEHPVHWDKNFWIEAELPDNLTGDNFIYTLKDPNAAANDYSKFVSHTLNNQKYTYNFEPTVPGDYAVHVRAAQQPSFNPIGVGSISLNMQVNDNMTSQVQPLTKANVPPCNITNQFEWYKASEFIRVSAADVLAGKIFTLTVHPSPAGKQPNIMVDCFYIGLEGAHPPQDLFNISLECNP
jgi:hypothetical protein